MNILFGKSIFNYSLTTTKYRCVLMRHGESILNKQNRFGGWIDVPLADSGVKDAQEATKLLQKEHFQFDIGYTSALTRSIQTFNIITEQMECMWIPVMHSWRLNERHYGALQGLNKTDVVDQYGEKQVKLWRRQSFVFRSYDQPPPALDEKDERLPQKDRRYRNVPSSILPKTECLRDTIARVIPLWNDFITQDILEGKNVLVIGHSSSLRNELIRLFSKISKYLEVLELNVPNSVPLVYEFDEDLHVLRSYYLGDQESVQKKIKAIAMQGAARNKLQ